MAKLHTFLYSTGSNLKSFSLFSKLPPNLQTKIFTLAAPPPRTHFLEIYNYQKLSHKSQNVRIRYIPPLPALFHTTHVSRVAIMAFHGGEIISLHTPPLNKTFFYFNFAYDIVFLSSRFLGPEPTSSFEKSIAPSTDFTETFRLRAMEGLMPFQHLKRLRRVVLTYSGHDEYKMFTYHLRWFKNLEVLYIAMVDWWSERQVKRAVRKGKIKVGAIREAIQGRLEKYKGEETDDDEDEDHSEEGVEEKKEIRVVEVELRLDE
ncbi:uncharacterized protein BDR25DRAFT_319831 [Lindgomyces ingoldianus]|uniref:Uncharacterized protein n=1 Tax=Lindgomyces ingoldianus TaxID=673940 RepID=A0ACB6Q9J4_9PLEO|nr:uncharacterized protein BDR25DRAFT_319831 [Lindgomyces ingoldianus]KAF2463624.1 hypothetical protein BDR25DRAFT_319831 [Lindgomyces ingoldianus]